jgi:hypothetical protein
LGRQDGKHFIYVINTVSAFAATVACCFIMDLKPKLPEAPKGLLDDALSAGR